MAHPLSSPTRVASRSFALLLAAAAVFAAGCGGGGSAGVSSGGTGGTGAPATSFASGTISGFGSVIVNGVRYDDSAARVTDDDGNVASRDALKLGMGVEVKGGAVSDDGTGPRGAAREIRFGAELVGAVTAIDAAAKSLTIVGQTVLVQDTTVIDDRIVGGFAGIDVGALLEVHGTLDAATGAYTASRIQPTAAAAGFRIRGIVANLDTVAKTFTIGAATISYAGIAPVPVTLANGARVRVRLQPVPVAGVWIATRLDDAGRRPDDASEVELKGTVTAFTSRTAFSVDGIAVDASNAVFGDGTATGLVLGARVEVKGSAVNGVVVATRVTVEDHAEHHAEGFELHGAITALDTTAKTFVLRGTTVGYGVGTVEFRKGTEAQLAVGALIEARGVLAADGTTLQATRITFGD